MGYNRDMKMIPVRVRMPPWVVEIVRDYADDSCEGNMSMAVRRLLLKGWKTVVAGCSLGEILTDDEE